MLQGLAVLCPSEPMKKIHNMSSILLGTTHASHQEQFEPHLPNYWLMQEKMTPVSQRS